MVRSSGCRRAVEAADLDGNGVIANNEGVSTISPALGSVGARDAIRQQAVDLMQLIRVLEGGVDVEGDGIVDLDPSRISYFGISFGAGAFGPLLMAVDPAVKVGVLASPGGLNSRFDLLRLRPSARSQVGSALAARVPSLLNPPGLTTWAGIPVAPPFFNENIPLRDQAVVTDAVDGAMDIQRYFDRVEWITNSGDGVSYAPHIRRDPLAGMPRKTMLVNFGKGDQSAPNPRTTQLIRAGGLGKVTTFYRNDFAYAEDNSVLKNPHTACSDGCSRASRDRLPGQGLTRSASFSRHEGGRSSLRSRPGSSRCRSPDRCRKTFRSIR